MASRTAVSPPPPSLPPSPCLCRSDAPKHDPTPRCGPELAEVSISLGTPGGTQGRVSAAQHWCDTHTACSGFALDPGLAIALMFATSNATKALQPNPAWTAFFRGPPQPAPRPQPPPGPAPPSSWAPILPAGRCSKDEDCSLNGKCNTASGDCVCTASWTGHNCQELALRPLPAAPGGYGVIPNVTSWGGSIWHNGSEPGSLYHLFVTEETDGRGLASWISNSQIVHAVAADPLGPYTKRAVVSKPPTTNPQILYDARYQRPQLRLRPPFFNVMISGPFHVLSSGK